MGETSDTSNQYVQRFKVTGYCWNQAGSILSQLYQKLYLYVIKYAFKCFSTDTLAGMWLFFREEVPLSTSLFELADRLLGFNRYVCIWKELQFRVINWSSCLTLPVKQTPYTPGKVCFITSTFGLEMDIKSMSGTAHYSWLQGPVWLLFSEKKPPVILSRTNLSGSETACNWISPYFTTSNEMLSSSVFLCRAWSLSLTNSSGSRIVLCSLYPPSFFCQTAAAQEWTKKKWNILVTFGVFFTSWYYSSKTLFARMSGHRVGVNVPRQPQISVCGRVGRTLVSCCCINKLSPGPPRLF